VAETSKRRLAARWGLNAESPIAREILENLDLSVLEFVAATRKARVLREMPADMLSRTIREALDGGDPKVRKLLLDQRWRKR